ncbi:FAD-binding oxidoreductase [Streptomyces boluensis]|uniref:FAD-binding protein n=1 Tax=Streptomyces boluensis TaxID=1775135 RepID=A0A964XI88_9ACTN|nr:FAD-binding oxidoreductase [Streptomyces boluensis]NBE49959.1 FAD-binding protein [Streptomyces boluensis]
MTEIARGERITPEDDRYPSLLEGYNHRFTGSPDYVGLVTSTDEVVTAVEEAVAAGKRIVVRSGGHCFEDFTSSPDVEVLVDLSRMNSVSYDERLAAFAIEGGANLEQVYTELHKGWGVTVPAGTCFEVGVGGHFTAGGYGHLSRRDGLVVDHLYAVEVVTVDASGKARVTIATREPDDPHRDLWWAHTGGGGGNFGIVTRYWMRRPGDRPATAADALPQAPARMLRADVSWSWDTIDAHALTTLLRNYGTWYEQNSAPDSPYKQLWTNLIVTHRSAGGFGMTAVIDADVHDAEGLLTAHLEAVVAGTGVEPTVTREEVDWMGTWLPSYSWPSDPRGRYKNKAGYLRKGFTEHQLDALYRRLSQSDYSNPMACLVLTGFGGEVNAVAPDATAVAQRDCVLKASYSAFWQSAEEDDHHIAWAREFYRDVYAETGGVPVPDEVNDGSYIGYPDVDLASPEWNTSGVGWQALYYKGNYPRLQQVKRRYDPRDVFRHGLSVELPG